MKKLQIICAAFAPFCLMFSLWSAKIVWSPLFLAVMAGAVFTKSGREAAVFTDRATPAAVVIFLMCSALGFNPPQMMYLHLFVFFVVGLRALNVLTQTQLVHAKPVTFVLIMAACAGISYGLATMNIPFFYAGGVTACLLCKTGTQKQSAQDVWNDFAFPGAVLLFSFGALTVVNHLHLNNARLAEACLMVMIGGFIPAVTKSPVRLALMTAVLYVVSRYV